MTSGNSDMFFHVWQASSDCLEGINEWLSGGGCPQQEEASWAPLFNPSVTLHKASKRDLRDTALEQSQSVSDYGRRSEERLWLCQHQKHQGTASPVQGPSPIPGLSPIALSPLGLSQPNGSFLFLTKPWGKQDRDSSREYIATEGALHEDKFIIPK